MTPTTSPRAGSITILALLGASLLIFTGCASKPTTVVRPIRLPEMPAVPAARDVPIDQGLRASARQELLTAFHSADPIIRSHAVEAMQESIGPQMAPRIIDALSDRAALVRFSAALAAGELKLADAKPTLLNLVDDPDASVRIGAKFALHRLGDTQYSHDFEKTALDPVKQTRGNTALVLGMLGNPSASRILIPMLRDSEFTVRIQAAEALWRLHDQRGLNDLIAATISAYPDDQMVALLALARPRDQRVMQNIRGALTSQYPEVALVAARCLGMLGSDEGYGVAEKGTRSADPRQRLLAAVALGAIGRPDAQNLLSPMLKDSSPEVRVAAAAAILDLKPLKIAQKAP